MHLFSILFSLSLLRDSGELILFYKDMNVAHYHELIQLFIFIDDKEKLWTTRKANILDDLKMMHSTIEELKSQKKLVFKCIKKSGQNLSNLAFLHQNARTRHCPPNTYHTIDL